MKSLSDKADPSGPMDFPTSTAWEKWLSKHHTQGDGAWLLIAKKGSGLPSITIAEALDVALCYGWIDSHRKSFDDTRVQKAMEKLGGSKVR